MEFKLTEEAIRSSIIYEGSSEQAVDCEIMLPDYCPDISRILKCQMIPKVVSAQPNGTKLMLEGTTKVKILYVNEDGIIHTYEQTVAYQASSGIEDDLAGASIKTSQKVSYVNCHAITGRKIDVHGAFSINFKATVPSEAQVLSDIEADNIELCKENLSQSKYVGEVQKSFTATETFELASGKPSIEAIIRSCASAKLDDAKVIAGKIILKGEIPVKVLYRTDKGHGSTDIMEYTIPISNIIDFDGIDDRCVTNVTLEVFDAEMAIKTDSDGECRLIESEIKITVSACAYEPCETAIIKDLYSTEYNTVVTEKNIKSSTVACNISDTFISKESFDLPEDGITQIIDMWCEPLSLKQSESDDGIVLKGQNNVCMLTADDSLTLSYYERVSDFEYAVKNISNTNNIKCDASHSILGTTYSMSASGIEVRNEISISGLVMNVQNIKTVASVEAADKIDKNKYSALIIYYADTGEAVWDIAKKYCTSAKLIMEENELEQDEIDKAKMLLIPIC